MEAQLDTLLIFDRLKKSFTEEQAHAISEILKEIRETDLKPAATKQDLKELEFRLKYDLTLRMGSIVGAGVAILAAIKFFS